MSGHRGAGINGAATSSPRHPVWDTIASGLLTVAVLALSPYAFLLAAFIPAMTANTCNDECNYGAVNAAVLIAWGGIVVALLCTVAGIVWSYRRGRLAFYWPLLGLVTIVATWILGLTIATAAGGP